MDFTSKDITPYSVCAARDGKVETIYVAFHWVDDDDPEGVGEPLLVLYNEIRDGRNPQARDWADIIVNEIWDGEQERNPDVVYGVADRRY